MRRVCLISDSRASAPFATCGLPAVLAVALLVANGVCCGGEPQPTAGFRVIELTDRIPWGQQPVDYLGSATDDAISRLDRQLEAGAVQLESTGPHGRLLPLLELLEIPLSSQVLVFSKTSVSRKLISPATPRAIYFNETTYVAAVPGSGVLEVSAVDPAKGANFYVLPRDPQTPARFRRERRCLACHSGNSSLNVPGHLVRSFVTDETGQPVTGYSRISHEATLSRRFGGWYATGTVGKQHHLGNLFGAEVIERHRQQPGSLSNLRDLSRLMDTSTLPTPHSDLVAQLVLHHQLHGQNLLTRAGFEYRLKRRSNVNEHVVRYLLFMDEPELTEPVAGTSTFARDFMTAVRDQPGRELRQLDLQHRLLRTRLSWLVDSPLFRGLPPAVRESLLQEMHAAVAGRTPELAGKPVPQFPPAEQQAIAALLKQLYPGGNSSLENTGSTE